MSRILRSAIYTRKSCEEGLEQGFNSLHAQREACEAYVLSQAGEGWSPIKTIYDDGGFSGGNMQRPGLEALLADIKRGQVDIVVVYKVDRLTRSLADFARIVELFDQHQVSFVSVTQAFNTTTSMGRLTLNVLLSFAQFEREVTGERIRDKIAASKARGLWMGGRPPLGYDGRDRKLVINPTEAETVRHIFRRYLELGSVTSLQPDLERRSVRSKQWVNKRGQLVGGAVLSRGALYHMLANPVYRGAIRHGAKIYGEAHPPLVDQSLWTAVQDKLGANAPDHPSAPRLPAEVLLRGLLFDDRGGAMAPIHANRRGKRYRYYVSAAKLRPSLARAGSVARISMGVLDAFVCSQVAPLLSAGWSPDLPLERRVCGALVGVILGEDRVIIRVRREAASAIASCGAGASLATIVEGLELTVAVRLRHRQGATMITSPGLEGGPPRMDRALIRAITLASAWAKKLARGEVGSLNQLARQEGYCNHYAAKLMPLAWLAPQLVELIVQGRQPTTLILSELIKAPLPADWREQAGRVGSTGDSATRPHLLAARLRSI